jgi:hypothetical protein
MSIRSNPGGIAVSVSHSSSASALERALRDASAPKRTRRWLLERAAAGGAAAAVGGSLLAVDDASARPAGDSVGQFGEFAATSEALTVTLLTELLRRVSVQKPAVPAGVVAVFEGAYAAELDHWRFIHKHFRAQTRRFWIPDAFFGGPGDTLSLTAIGHALVAGETLFVNTYLIGVTTFAAAGRPMFSRFMAELAGVEAEHRVLAQTLINATPPNDLGFEAFRFQHVRAITTALEQAGVGFGRQGTSPGRFYQFPRPPMPPPIPIGSNKPQ